MVKGKEISLENLSVGYPKGEAVISGINEVLNSNKLIALVGNNGSGKTTFLRTLVQELCPIHGKIMLGDQNLEQYGSEQLAKEIAVVFTGRQATMGLSVKTVIGLGRHPYLGFMGNLAAKDEQHIDTMVGLMGIEQLLDKTMEEISDGEYQKVMITRALIQDTSIILLDEPLAYLDYNSKVSLLKTLKTIVDSTQKLILFSAHELDLLSTIIDGVLSVQDGKMELITQNISEYLSTNFMS